ncbi:MAG: histidinol dehydrogenase [Anaerolineae bacterium]|jgi:histidinol dehydrogenase|nr:histidinol dehydrogenase [Chloroflexota bacterium]
MKGQPVIRLAVGAQATRDTVLRRQPLEEMEASPELQRSIETLFGAPLTPDQVVERILREVAAKGDAAVTRYSSLLDGDTQGMLRVPAERIEQAWANTPEALRQSLQLAAARIESFYQHQPRQSWMAWGESGGGVGQIIRPLDRVAVYAPNGRAAYPSSLLMAAIPARVAGVPEIVVATPVRQGKLNDTILAAARVAGASEVYAMGGAQAIAALAFGTETVRPVDKILGPGNIFVVLAKRRVYGRVGIDALPGPTETLLIADDSARPGWVAADLLAQAEHDPLATAILLTDSATLAEQVQAQAALQLRSLERKEVISASLGNRGGIGLVASLGEALQLANAYAPEHLCLLTRDPWSLVGQVRNAGGVFVGEYSSEALGDYVTGPSHIMPTGGTARFSSPVNLWDFVKITSVFGVSATESATIGSAAEAIARAEGLTAHAAAVRARTASGQDCATTDEGGQSERC